MNYDKLRLPFGVHWYEGMLLTPQHFQQTDHYFSELIRFWASSFSKNFWGILDLEIDLFALPQGIFRLQKAQVIFPDGLAFDYAPEATASLSIDLNQMKGDIRINPIIISLRAPKLTEPNLLSVDGRYGDTIQTQEAD